MAHLWLESLSDSEIMARLMQRGVDADDAAYWVSQRQTTEGITTIVQCLEEP